MISIVPRLWEHQLLQEGRLSHGEEHAAVLVGRQGLGIFPSAYCQVTFCRKEHRKGMRDQRALDPPVT